VALGDDYDVDWPEGACVVIGENVVGFAHHVDLRPSTQHLVAIKIFCHCEEILRIFADQKQESVIFFGTHGLVVSVTAQQTYSPGGVSHAYTNHSVLDTDVVLRWIGYGPTARAGILAQSWL